MAVRLNTLGLEPGLVAMFDSYPSECWRAEAEPTEAQAIRSLLSIAGYDPEDHPQLVTREAILGFLRAGDSPLGRLPAEGLDGVTRVVLDTNRLVRQHHHTRYGGTLTHIRAGLDHTGKPLFPELWQPYTQTLDLVSVPFLHPQLTSAAAIADIAPQLIRRLDTIDRERLN
jgi:enterobactin synthetase component F